MYTIFSEIVQISRNHHSAIPENVSTSMHSSMFRQLRLNGGTDWRIAKQFFLQKQINAVYCESLMSL